MTQGGQELHVKGPKGEVTVKVLPHVVVTVQSGAVSVKPITEEKESSMYSGTMWSLIRNALEGVSGGFLKVLEIEGIGYKAAMEAKTLVLSLGFTNQVRFDPPPGVTIVVEKATIKISGVNKELVGRVAAQIRSLKKPEPYKGKGIHYVDEVIRRKAGKKAAAAGGSQ